MTKDDPLAKKSAITAEDLVGRNVLNSQQAENRKYFDSWFGNYKEQIKLEYINIKSFYVDLQSRYFHDYLSGKPGLVGVNEFMYENDCLTHEIYFCSTESLKITYKKLKITVSK